MAEHPFRIAISSTLPDDPRARHLANELGLPMVTSGEEHAFDLLLCYHQDHLELRADGPGAPGPVYVDFIGGRLGHRRRFGGGLGQPLARAVGAGRGHYPDVLDTTAGLGRDAFVLACLGCRVQLLERSRVVAALLRDGLQRALLDPETGPIVSERMSLVVADAIDYMKGLPEEKHPEVVYLDPMYPMRSKSALVKKEMRLFHTLLGQDLDSAQLLAAALTCARKRVVVKRPKLAPPLQGPAPTMSIHGKTTRYDVYVIAALTL